MTCNSSLVAYPMRKVLSSYETVALIAALVISFTLLGCASDNSAALDATTSTVSISSSLSYGKAALTSAGNSTNSTNAFGLSSTLAETQSSTDPTCTTVGNVYKSGETDDRMPASNTEYPFKQLYCKLTYNSYSSETLIGFLDMWGSIVCAMESALGSLNWQASPSAQSVTVTIAAGSCFSSSLATALTSGGMSQVTIPDLKLYQLDGTTGYDYKMTFTAPGSTDIEIQFRLDSNYVAFHLKEAQTDQTTYTMVTIDRTDQQIRFAQGQTDKSTGMQFQKLLIKGTINSATGELTSVTESQGYYVFLSGQNNNWSEYGSLKSLSGGNVVGYSASQDNSNTVTNGANNRCGSDGSGTCTGNTGIALTDSDLDTFYTNRATLTNNMASANLLSFDNVALTTTVTSITGR